MNDDSQISGDAVFNWRIHWIYCELRHITTPQQSKEQLAAALTKAHSAFERLVWEYNTMMSFDDENRARSRLVALGAYVRLHAEVQKYQEAYGNRVHVEAENLLCQQKEFLRTIRFPQPAQEPESHE